MSFLWAQGFGVSESSQAQPSREQNLTIPRYTVEFGEWLGGPESNRNVKPWELSLRTP